MKNIIYTDYCCDNLKKEINKKLNLDVVLRMDYSSWTLSDTMSIITIPNIKLAVINKIDEISVIEMGLLNFLCKPILITAPIKGYPILESKIVDFIEPTCKLDKEDSNFITWYKNFI